MCGIVGYVGKNEAVPILLHGLEKLEYRGYDSAGVAVYSGGEICITKSKGRLTNLQEKLEVEPLKGYIGIGHTRWATHGAPSDENSHPHYSTDQEIAVVHNGIIENYILLKKELQDEGYEFTSETDTETIVHLLDYYIKKGMDIFDAIYKCVKRLEGSYAIGVINKAEPDRLIVARKDSPLIIGIGEDGNFVASDVPAILQYTKKVYLLEDYEIAEITTDDIIIYDRNKEIVKRDVFTVDWDIESAEKGGYEFFMEKEIHEQSKVVKDSLLPRLGNSHIHMSDLNLTKEGISNINKIYIVACGTAYYAGMVGKYLIENQCRIPVQNQVASEFRYNNPIIDENTLIIVVSQSGETADTLAAVKMAKKKGASVLGIVNVVGSSIARESDYVFYTVAGPEIAVASTKAFSAQICAMYLLTIHLGMLVGKISTEEYVEYKKEMEKLPKLIKEVLNKADDIKKLADKYLDAKNVFYIGRGLDYMIAMEGSLKLKEIAYLHSEPYAAGELKHGPLALIEKETLIVGLVSQERMFDKTAGNIKECKARGARVLAICMEGNDTVKDYADETFYIPRTNWIFAPLLANIPQQLFAFYMAKGLGNDVDKPRNLAKSVTVE